jgi:hypothetical protein
MQYSMGIAIVLILKNISYRVQFIKVKLTVQDIVIIKMCDMQGFILSLEAMSHNVSRASAAALSTVLRTTTLSYGNMRFSGNCPAETPQPIKMKFSTIDYVDEITRCAKNGCNRLAGGGPTDR